MANYRNLFKMGGEVDLPKTTLTAISIVGLILILLVWHFISVFEIIPTAILPEPLKVITSYGYLFENHHLLANSWYSVKLNLSCYFWAILISIPVGFFIGLYPINNIVVGRYINAIRYIPAPACVGIFISLFGLTFGLKTGFLTFCIVIYLIPAICNKINEIQNPKNDNEFVYLQTIKTLGATPWQKFKEVYFPYVMGSITDDIINLTAVSYSYLVICETIFKSGTVNGLGSLIGVMSRQAHMDAVYALLFLIIVIGILQDLMFKFIDKKLFSWKY